MSSITYHFGGKRGLHLAAADHITESMAAFSAPALGRISHARHGERTPVSARKDLHILVAHMVEVMVRPEMAALARFVAREQADPTEAFDRIYAGAVGPLLHRVASLLRTVAKDTLDEYSARLRAVTILGEILVIRNARATLLASAGWNEIGEAESRELELHIADNLEAVLDRLEARRYAS